MTPLETKKAFIEALFWFTALTVIRLAGVLIALFANHSYPDKGKIIFILTTIVIGNLVSALVLTLLNRLLQVILRRVQ